MIKAPKLTPQGGVGEVVDPPSLPIRLVSQAVNVAVTTAAKAAPMMNATASSTRLPRRMKFLKPFMGVPLETWTELPGQRNAVTLA